MIRFSLEKIADGNTGGMIDNLVKHTMDDAAAEETSEVWCSVQDLDILFSACTERWGDNWDLNKLVVAIKESQID